MTGFLEQSLSTRGAPYCSQTHISPTGLLVARRGVATYPGLVNPSALLITNACTTRHEFRPRLLNVTRAQQMLMVLWLAKDATRSERRAHPIDNALMNSTAPTDRSSVPSRYSKAGSTRSWPPKQKTALAVPELLRAGQLEKLDGHCT